jgi:hypothetical protein
MKKIKDLKIENFPGVNPDEFEKWKNAAIEQSNLALLFGILALPNKRRLDKMRRNIGIDDDMLKSALGLKENRWITYVILPLSVLLTIGGGICVNAGVSEITKNNFPDYIWISLVALLIGIYFAFLYRKVYVKVGGKQSDGGLIFFGVLGIIGSILSYGMGTHGGFSEEYTFLLLSKIWIITIIQFLGAIFLIFLGTKYFNNLTK